MTDIMTCTSSLSNGLDDELRFDYLQAMGINCWEPKSNLELGLQSEIKKTKLQKTEENHLGVIPHEDSAKVNSIQKETKVPIFNKQTVEIKPKENPEQVKNIHTKAYLKLVAWENQNLKKESAKNLLIICRHQIDQPANSFATQNSPSQFMLDYINALEFFVQKYSFGLNIKMAHLSEAGLGKDAVPMDNVLENLQPDIILLLGDETTSHLFGKQVEVASLRGQFVDLNPKYKAVVSYHPYSLIKNSSLKSLALDDLINLADCFSSFE